MENKKPEFGFKEHSVIALVTEMRSYFKDLKSFYGISKGELLSKLEASTDEQETKQLEAQLKEINQKIAYFTVLSDSLSIADTVLHTEAMIAELCKKSKS